MLFMVCNSSDLNRVGKYLDSLLEEYTNLLCVARDEGDDELVVRYSAFVECIGRLNRDLFYPSDFEDLNVVRELLRQNYGKCDSWVELVDGTGFSIGYDDLVDVVDGFLVVRDKEEFERDCTVIPSIVKVVNVDCIVRVECMDNIVMGLDDLKLK